MRQLASALQRLAIVNGETTLDSNDAVRLEGARQFLRHDRSDAGLRPHIVATPNILVPAAQNCPSAQNDAVTELSGISSTVGGLGIGDRYRHEYQQIVAHMRDLCSSRRSAVVSILSTSESNTTAELTRDLALCLVRQGEQPILLVDANFWDRRLSLCCDAGSHHGLSDVIAGWSWRNVVVPMSGLNLSLLPAGSGFVHRPDGLSWSGLMDDWRDAFRWVLIDGGPSGMWLAEGLCKSSDEIILHSHLEEDESLELETAVRRIRRLGSRLVGGIFTDRDWRQAG